MFSQVVQQLDAEVTDLEGAIHVDFRECCAKGLDGEDVAYDALIITKELRYVTCERTTVGEKHTSTHKAS